MGLITNVKEILEIPKYFLIVGVSIIITFWEYIKIFSVSLHKLFSSEFIFSSTSLIISLLIPIAIMLLGSKKGSNPIENRWAQKVLKKQIIHFKDVLNYIIIILILLMVNQLFPQLTVLLQALFSYVYII